MDLLLFLVELFLQLLYHAPVLNQQAVLQTFEADVLLVGDAASDA